MTVELIRVDVLATTALMSVFVFFGLWSLVLLIKDIVNAYRKRKQNS